MNCDCYCDASGYSGDNDFCHFISKSNPVAKKEHICTECKRVIKKGEQYEYWFVVCGKPSTYKTCIDCISVRNVFFRNNWTFTEIYWDLCDFIIEIDGDISSDCIRKLTPAARIKICDMIEEAWERNNE